MANYILTKTNEGYSVYYHNPVNKYNGLLAEKKTLSEAISRIILSDRLRGGDPHKAIKFENFKPDKETRGLIALALVEYRRSSKLEQELEELKRYDTSIYED